MARIDKVSVDRSRFFIVPSQAMKKYPYVITISSEKGGVGKTTLATNLAIYLKALSEDLPVSVVSLDNHFTVDKMFCHQRAENHRRCHRSSS